MSTHGPLVALVVAMVALAAVPAAAVAQDTTQTPTATTNQTTADGQLPEQANATLPPGAMLSGAVDVGQAEVDGTVERRAYGIQIAQAKTDDATADVVAERLAAIEQRIQQLEDRRDALQAARENDSISDAEYKSKVAGLHARTETVKAMANTSNETASGLPVAALEAKGINATAIKTLSERASELSGPEVAAIARSIAGPGVGQGPPAWAGPGGSSGNASDGDQRRGPPGDVGPGNAGPGGDAGPGDDAAENESDAAENESETAENESERSPDGDDVTDGGDVTEDGTVTATADADDGEDAGSAALLFGLLP